jgi:hypothetical protein
VPALQPALPVPAPRQERAQLPRRPPGKVAPGTLAADFCWAALASGEGARIGLLGDPGSGKSTAARHLARLYLERCRGLVAVADSKGDGGWSGEMRESVAALADAPPAGREIVFSPSPFGEPLDLESVARWQWALAARRCRSLVVYDELSDACDDGDFRDGVVDLQRVFTHGRRVGISAIWGAQFAQLVPRAPYECSSCLLVWRQAGNALAVLRRRGYTDAAVEEVIRSLPGDDVPPAERGAFVLLRRGRPWDGLVYRF